MNRNASSHIHYSELLYSLSRSSTRAPKLGFLASHNGTSMQAIIAAQKKGVLPGTTEIIISNNTDSPALAYGVENGICTVHASRKTIPDPMELDAHIAQLLAPCDWVILSGYMRPIGMQVIAKFPEHIINIHPGILPEFGGHGMYGDHVHQKVIAARSLESGITIHLVDSIYDHGPILAQYHLVLAHDETVTSLAAQISALEPDFYVSTLAQLFSAPE